MIGCISRFLILHSMTSNLEPIEQNIPVGELEQSPSVSLGFTFALVFVVFLITSLGLESKTQLWPSREDFKLFSYFGLSLLWRITHTNWLPVHPHEWYFHFFPLEMGTGILCCGFTSKRLPRTSVINHNWKDKVRNAASKSFLCSYWFWGRPRADLRSVLHLRNP